MSRMLDRVLMALFAFAAFTALVYMPLFLLGCGWEGLAQGPQGECSNSVVGRAWLGYVEVEPVYARAPLWLRLLNEFDTWFFGWFYLLSLAVFIRGRQESPRYRALATFMSGMMAYAMFFYLTQATLSWPDSGAKLGQVYTYNGLWLLLFTLLLARLYLFRPRPVLETAHG